MRIFSLDIRFMVVNLETVSPVDLRWHSLLLMPNGDS